MKISANTRRVWIFTLASLSLLLPHPVLAERIHIAVASNFTKTAQEITSAFQQKTGHKVIVSSGSTGKFYAQILNGAPFDIFMAADQKSIDKLIDTGFSSSDNRITYAIGKIALFSLNKQKITPDIIETLSADTVGRLAIANPKTAPYGRAALEILQALQLEKSLKPYLVTGENIAQAYQFVATGNAALGFVALSQIIDTQKGSRWIVPQSLYSPIRQDAVLLNKAKDKQTARAFFSYLQSKTALLIMQKYGYSPDA